MKTAEEIREARLMFAAGVFVCLAICGIAGGIGFNLGWASATERLREEQQAWQAEKRLWIEQAGDKVDETYGRTRTLESQYSRREDQLHLGRGGPR